MTVGDEEYKRFWADTKLPLYGCRYALTPKGIIAMALVHTWERAKKRAKKSPRVCALLSADKGSAVGRPGKPTGVIQR
jgi:CelD/BcsL family acetyltransferase involved in cellulose biosynthesis